MHQMIALHPIKGLEKKTFSNKEDLSQPSGYLWQGGKMW